MVIPDPYNLSGNMDFCLQPFIGKLNQL
jgi:hypothetical protein